MMSFLSESRSDNEIIEPRVSFDETPLSAIRQKTKNKLSDLLNSEKVLLSEEGYARDWRGLFRFSGLTQSDFTLISQSPDKTRKLLDLWLRRNKENVTEVTLSQLLHCLGLIDRYDVYDDTYDLLTEDAKVFLSKPQNNRESEDNFEIVKADLDSELITQQDLECYEKGLPLKTYDAFVIYNDKDVEFASELIENCERMGHSLCVKDRDLLGGLSFESEAILNLLSKRCNRLIIIISKAFLKSPMQLFITNFAQALGIEQGKRKIVPCLIEECELPQMLRYCFRLDYYRNNSRLFNFWDKLDQSLKTTTEVNRWNKDRVSFTEVDAAPNGLKLTMPTTPGPLYDKEHSYKFTETPTPTLSEKNDKSSKMFLSSKSSPEETRKIFPAPKLRSATSETNLNKLNGDSTKIYNKLSQSTFHLNDEPGMDAIKAKRKKWYKRFLPPSTKAIKIKTISEEPELPLKEDKKPLKEDKKKWYKINKKKNKEKIAIACES